MASLRIYVKKQIRLDRLNFQQRQMFELGSVGVAAVKNRLELGRGPADTSGKRLTSRYLGWKVRHGGMPYRNLSLSGDMLRNFAVRTVSEKQARAGVTGRGSIKTGWNKKRTRMVGVENRIKAWVNQKREEWMVFSPKNKASVLEAARRMLIAAKPRMLTQRLLGGTQQ